MDKIDSCYNEDKILDYILTIKIVNERIMLDFMQNMNELNKFQNLFQEYNITNRTKFNVLTKRINILYLYLYKTLINHLAVKTNVNGFGEFIIKPVNELYGTVTNIKYQNILKSNKLFHIQNTLNIYITDNISVTQILEEDIFVGLLINIGNLSFEIYNFDKLVINNTIMFDENDNIIDLTETLKTMFIHIDDQLKVLGNILTNLNTNINFLNKYIDGFETLIK